MYFGGFLRYRKKKIQSSVCWVRGSGDYDRKKKDSVVCLLGARFWQLRPEKKETVKKKIHYEWKEKRYSRLSDGCAVLAITTGKKKDTVILGNFHYDRKKKIHYDHKKKDTVVSGGQLAFFL